MKKSKLLLALFLGIFVVFQSCKKKEIVDNNNENTFEVPIYEYSKLLNIADKSGVKADVTIYGTSKKALNYNVQIIPIYQKPNSENLNSEINFIEEDFKEIPPVYFDIENVKLPESAIGFEIIPQSIDKWDNTIFGYGSKYDAGFITKTNSSGKTTYKMGVLYTGSQWFYNTVAKGTLKSKNSAAQAAPGDFYKMYIKYNNKYGSTCKAYFYSF